jgi:hypothetical protein
VYTSPFTSFKNPSPRGQKLEDVRGVQEILPTLSSSTYYYFLDSFCFLSDNTISIKCVLLRMWTPSILLSIHSSNSGDNLTATYSFTTLDTFLQCNTNEHINTCFTISTIVKHCKTNRIEGEWNGKQY